MLYKKIVFEKIKKINQNDEFLEAL